MRERDDEAAPAPSQPRHAVVVADGDVPAREDLDAAWPGWAAETDIVLAADGGFARARGLDLVPDVLVGDLDSLDPADAEAAGAAGIPILRSRVDKDESDTELALLEAVRLGAARITLLGAFGGARLDHALANVWLLAHPGLAEIPVTVLDARTRMRLVRAPDPGGGPVTCRLPGAVGGLVSLLPLGGDAEGITTAGLRYPLRGERLRTGPARGLSNERTAPDAIVTLERGCLLVVETAPARGGLSSGT
jgi:thiamine pyrophosphokinase